MNREKITLILCLLLTALCSAALLTTIHVRDSMVSLTDKALALDVQDNIPNMQKDEILPLIDGIANGWQKYEPIVSTYSRHDEVERVSSAVRRLRPLCDSGQFDELYMALHEISDSLDHLRSTELPTIANIL